MSPAQTTTFDVPDVSCDHCVVAITDKVRTVDGVFDVVVDLHDKQVLVTGGDETAVLAAIDEAGYDATTR